MSVTLSANGTILLEGDCPGDEAELLLQLLLSTPDAVIDWRSCTAAHSTLIQVMLAAGSPVLGPPSNSELARWVAPALRSTGR